MNNVKSALKDYITGFAHVGHIVEDMDDAIVRFKNLYGITDADIFIPANPPGMEVMTKFAFISVGETDFELIEPVSDHFKELLLGMPSGLGGINHVAYLVDDIDGAVACLAQNGITPGHVTPDGIVDTGQKKICYFDPATTGDLLIELIEDKIQVS